MNYKIEIKPIEKSNISNIDFENIPFGRVFTDHVFVADYKDGKWQNAEVCPFHRLSISPANMTLHYGQAIFEGMKAMRDKDGNPLLFRPEKHLIRLNASAKRMGIPALPEELFMGALNNLVGLDHAWVPESPSALYIRPFIFATDEFIGVRPSETYKFMVFLCPVGPYYTKPVKLLAADHYVRAFVGGTGFAKAAGNYAATLLPMREANEMGYDQIMWLDGNEFKYIQECGTMNLFFVIDDVVITPEADGTILKGITRNSVIALLKDHGYKYEVRKLPIAEVIEAHKSGKLTEIFGTGTAAVIAPVSELGYQGDKFELPPVDSWKFAPWLKNQINGIRTGQIEDTHKWIQKVPIMSKAPSV